MSRVVGAVISGILMLLLVPAPALGATCGAGSHNILCGTSSSSPPPPRATGGNHHASSVHHDPRYYGNGFCFITAPGCRLTPLSAALGGALLGGVQPANPAIPAAVQVGGGQVLTAFQRIPLPAPASQTQPAGKTLVNFDTIFFVDVHQFQRNLTLLGQRVDLDITPSSFTWTWGDGTTATTSTPGAPYPDKSVVHRYPHAKVTVAHQVTITWTARFRVNGGAWADVPGTATTTGPATNLRIAEAVPVLTGQR